MPITSPKTWPRWAWLVLAAAAIVPLLLGARELSTWPFEAPQAEPAKISAPLPLPFATKLDVDGLSARVKTVADTAASKAELAQMRAEVERLRTAVAALAGGNKRRAKEITTGSVK